MRSKIIKISRDALNTGSVVKFQILNMGAINSCSAFKAVEKYCKICNMEYLEQFDNDKIVAARLDFECYMLREKSDYLFQMINDGVMGASEDEK